MERKIHFRENWLIFLGIWGEAELILRIWGARENASFSGIKEAQTPRGMGDSSIYNK